MNHRSYLEAMGLTLWRLRDQPSPPEAAPAPALSALPAQTAVPSDAATPPGEPATEPEVAPPLIEAGTEKPPQPQAGPEATSPKPAGADTRIDPVGQADGQSGETGDDAPPDLDLPAEYLQWASLTEASDDDLFQEPAPSPEEQRAARIAGLDWEALAVEVENCTACPLHASRTRPVFGVGNRQADWLIIGEAPGAEEDRQGEPFVGKAGRLLDAMLQALELDRQKVFIANVLKSRPPNNRDPSPEEAAACWPFLARQIELIRPGLILAVGRIAAQLLLNTDTPVGKLRGRVHRLEPGGIPLVVTYHPAYLLRSPREKRKSWEDLQLARRTLADAPGRGRP